jgi:DNA primase
LSKDAGDDPHKRATLIKDITSSISVIPDLITRQVYIKDCAERLHMSEKVLTTEVVNLRKKKVEEAAKAEERKEMQEASVSAAPQANEPVRPMKQEKVPASPLEQNYYNLMQLVVRYGEQPIEVEGAVYTIGEVIIYTLEGDEITPPKPVYQTMMDEFKAHCKDEGFQAERFFKFHPDEQVSAMAIDMIADKYQFAKPENDVRMGELVTRLLYEIQLTVINLQIEALEAGLKQAQQTNNWETQMELLKHQPELLSQRNEICKILGNRVINI